jgi:hypothetical protein
MLARHTSSFTSSSEAAPRGRAVRIGLMILAALALIEWSTRAAWLPGSTDMNDYRSFEERAQSLVAAPAPRFVFIGDSVTDRVELELMEEEWQIATGDALATDKFIAYDSNLTTWYWIADQAFWKRDLRPDLIVVTYYHEVGLADSESRDVSNLAQFFTDSGDRPELFANDVTTIRQRAEYLLSSASLAFAMRDRIRDRTLNQFYRYRPFATSINEVNFQLEKEQSAGPANKPQTFHALRRFVTRARQEGVNVCFVAFRPRPEPAGPVEYDIHPEALQIIADAGMLHLDLRDMDVLGADKYEDNVHLNEAGRQIYSRRLSREIAKVWRLGD